VLTTLPAFALIMQATQHQLTNPSWRHICPSVHQVILSQLGHIHKAVAIAIMIHLSVLEVKKGCCRKTVVEMYASVKVYLRLQLAILINISTHTICALWLKKLYVYLTRSALISVLDARRSFAHLYRLHPRSRHIAQAIWQGCATQIWDILREHLHISATKSKQLYLLRTSGSVAVAYVNRRIGSKRLAQIAASSTYQLTLPYYLGIVNTVFQLNTISGSHNHILQFVCTGYAICLRNHLL